MVAGEPGQRSRPLAQPHRRVQEARRELTGRAARLARSIWRCRSDASPPSVWVWIMNELPEGMPLSPPYPADLTVTPVGAPPAPPAQPPTAPPTPPFAATPEPPGSPERPRHGTGTKAGIAALVVALILAAGAAGRLTAPTSTSASNTLATTPSAPSTLPSSGSNTQTNPSSSFDPSAIAAAVNPSIVDINTTLAGGAAAGTGMIITTSGLVLTNNHVIQDATSISVQISGTGPSYSAHVVGYDIADDVALVQIEHPPSTLRAISIGKSSSVAVGQPIVAIGNALGRGGTPVATTGSITALNQTITVQDEHGGSHTLHGLLELNAPIQPGDSGGPVVNSSGVVIGMDTAASTGRFNQASNDAFAVPIDTAMSVVNQIRSGQESGNVHIGDRGILGVGVQDTTDTSGAQVVTVQSSSPAASAGLSVGDTIVTVDSAAITSTDDLSAALLHGHPGDNVKVGWIDGNGQRHSATVQLVIGPPA